LSNLHEKMTPNVHKDIMASFIQSQVKIENSDFFLGVGSMVDGLGPAL